MNTSTAKNAVQWLFLDLNAFFASCEQQENPALRGKPVIVVQTPAETAVPIAASYAPKAFGIGQGVRHQDRHPRARGSALVRKGGIVIMSLRHGPMPPKFWGAAQWSGRGFIGGPP
jgi:impB/mucB/samB family